MDIRRSAESGAQTVDGASGSLNRGAVRSKGNQMGGFRYVIFAFVVLVGLLGGLTALLLALNNNSTGLQPNEKKYQAVFLNGGQVYFGKMSDINSKYVTIRDIYYLRVNQQVQPNQQNTQTQQPDVTLAKLGSELHGPEDVMYVNREQVLFWENLKDDGQVVQAITKYKANPTGAQGSNSSATPTPSPTAAPTTKK